MPQFSGHFSIQDRSTSLFQHSLRTEWSIRTSEKSSRCPAAERLSKAVVFASENQFRHSSTSSCASNIFPLIPNLHANQRQQEAEPNSSRRRPPWENPPLVVLAALIQQQADYIISSLEQEPSRLQRRESDWGVEVAERSFCPVALFSHLWRKPQQEARFCRLRLQ